MKLIEFSRGSVGMPEGIEGASVFICPGYVMAVVPMANDRRLSFVHLVSGIGEVIVGAPSEVAKRLAGAGVDRLPRMTGRSPADPDRPWIA